MLANLLARGYTIRWGSYALAGLKEDAEVEERFAELDRVAAGPALLGYLNFSDGKPDPRWQRQLNDAYASLAQHGAAEPWTELLRWLSATLQRVGASGGAFRDASQAEAVLAAVADLLPAYRQYHADLLAHQDDRTLFGPFFLARACEAVLAQRAANPDEPIASASVLARLNDFVGHRPIATLETRPQGEPYEHERHRPVPLSLRGAGVAWGPYQAVIGQALEILAGTDPDLRAEAQLDLDLLDELALDVRAYDHGHPANRRPNYVFGEWDPHTLDNQGRYRRYVVRQVTLDALLERVARADGAAGEHLFEAAAVLAGTILMASGVSGWGPAAHDSSTTLAALLPRIARYRDAFYQKLLARLQGPHAERLRQEQNATRQPFGAVRQHLNGAIARHRAGQMQQRYLALLFAEMGYPAASREEARRIPAASMRLLSELLGELTSGRLAVEGGDLHGAARRLPAAEQLLHRGIACGAFADPWNVLGFQGLFPLSPAREDSVRDPRIDELLQSVEGLLNLYSRLLGEAAAAGATELVGTLRGGMDRLAAWWDRFATMDVGDLRRVHGGELAAAAGHVATALGRWHQRGAAVADLAFWRGHLEGFRSPRAFAMVVDTLLRKGDFRAAQALLCSWLGQAEQVPLEEGGGAHAAGLRGPLPDGSASFHSLALRWLLALTRGDGPGRAPSPQVDRRHLSVEQVDRRHDSGEQPDRRHLTLTAAERRGLVEKFFDHLEANADENWQVPRLEIVEAEVEEEGGDLYGAAYEGVTFEDSGDPDEGAVVGDDGPREPFDLEEEGESIEKRLRFLSTLSRLWRVAARWIVTSWKEGGSPTPAPAGWLAQARANQGRLLTLLDAIHLHPVPDPSGDYDSLVEFDRRRGLKEQLLYTTIGTCLDTALAQSALRAACAGPEAPQTVASGAGWEPLGVRLEEALFAADLPTTRALLSPFLERFQAEPLLFTPLTEGGSPRPILRVRIAQSVLGELLANLPRLGLLRETYDVLRTARGMEQARPSAGRGVTEFNHFFQAAYQAVVESVLASAATWPEERGGDTALVDLLERLTAPFLALWIDHSRTLQLSVLEAVGGENEWQALRSFVQRYGADLFHARFLTLANLRAILHRGVASHLEYLRDNVDPLRPVRLLDDLGGAIRREDAMRRLEIVLQAVVENYEEYKDYNTTTTQSDYGENLHVLLDFLRLKAQYERHAWQFRPLVLAHEVLARRGRAAAAVLWEESLTRFTRDLGRQQLDQLARLERTHGVRLGTIGDRLQERFVKPLALDRLCALIEPAMSEARVGGGGAFDGLRRELASYTATPVGVGLDVPFWLRRMEMEVSRVQATQTTVAALAEHFFRVPRQVLSHDELLRQLQDWERPALPQ